MLKANLNNITNKLYADAFYTGHYVPGFGRTLYGNFNVEQSLDAGFGDP